jgi:hypothetical protein
MSYREKAKKARLTAVSYLFESVAGVLLDPSTSINLNQGFEQFLQYGKSNSTASGDMRGQEHLACLLATMVVCCEPACRMSNGSMLKPYFSPLSFRNAVVGPCENAPVKISWLLTKSRIELGAGLNWVKERTRVYSSTTVLEYVHVYCNTYTWTNITLSQKRLEIRALRCNGDTS